MGRKTGGMDTLSLICLSIIGFQLSRFLYRIFFKHYLAPKIGFGSINLKEMGKWAVITGATDGVGKAYAEILAQKGLSVVLISRTLSKLQEVAKEIETKYGVETKVISADFTEGDHIYHNIDKQLQGLEVGVLINNVGMSYPFPQYFLEQPENSNLYNNIINCNIVSVTHMCKIVMLGMVERKKGVIVNVSSTAAQIPSPLLTVYAASKAYIDKFSNDLAQEYAQRGIVVQCVLPGYVATKMAKIRRSTWMVPSPNTFVHEAINTIGISDKTTGYFAHTLMVTFIHSLDYLSPKLSQWLVRGTMESLRRRALRNK